MEKDQFALQQIAHQAGPCLKVYLLGPAWVVWQGKPLVICRRQARALLYRLAAQLQPVPRAELCLAFWPEAPEAIVHRNLSGLLVHLRQALPAPDLLVGSNDLIGLDVERVWCDAAEFRATCGQLRTRVPAILEGALVIYRGRFLAGFSLPEAPEFEAWVARQRNELEHIYLDALAVLVDAEANRADYAQAILYAREYLKVATVAEAMHRQLMVLYARMGDRPAALRQYRDCAAVLERELNVAPLPATQAVYRAIMQNEL